MARSSLLEAVSTYLKLGKVVGGAATLSGATQAWRATRQAYLPENKLDGREAQLIQGATSLSTAR
jgi:hypothetical protein